MSWLASGPALIALLLTMPGAVLAERYRNQCRVRAIYGQAARVALLLCAALPFFLPPAALPLALVLVWTLKTLPDLVDGMGFTSVMARAVSPGRLARLTGTRWAMAGVVSAVSSALFGWMLERMRYPLNYQVVFLVSAVTAFADVALFTQIRVPLLDRPAPTTSRSLVVRLRAYLGPVFRYRPFLRYQAATVLYTVTTSLPSALLSYFWVNNLRAPDAILGLRTSANSVASTVGCLLWARIIHRIGARKALLISAAGAALYPVLTALSPSPAWLVPVGALYGLSVPGASIALFDLMARSFSKERQPLFVGVHSQIQSAALFVGPLLGGALAGWLPVGTVLLLAGLLQTLALIPLRLLPRQVES
jgi:MFS family permease